MQMMSFCLCFVVTRHTNDNEDVLLAFLILVVNVNVEDVIVLL